MARMVRAREGWVQFLKWVQAIQTKPMCTGCKKPIIGNYNDDKVGERSGNGLDAYKQLDKLDFATAAKILFTTTPKTKKFGIDFHLVQFFFACMPSLAVYLVAQYARYEMRKMEAELELKKKAEEEQKANEMERIAAEEKEKEESDPKLLEVKVRLDKLEETVKEIVVYSKKQPDSTTTKRQEEDTEEKRIAATEPIYSESSSKAGNNAATKDNLSKQSSAEVTPDSGQERDRKLERVTDASLQDQKGVSRNGEGHS